MGKKTQDRLMKCIAAVGALCLFCVIVFWSVNYDKGTDTTYDIVCLGDSNFGNYQDETGIAVLLSEKTGKDVLNGAFGGSMMTKRQGMKTEYQSALSMHSLAIAICNRNFCVQRAAIDTIVRRDNLGYFEKTFDVLSNVDFEQVEILIIEHGINDYMLGTPIKNGVDLYDTNTFAGTIRTVVDMLRKEYPDLRIILVTPAYCAPLMADGELHYCDEYTYGGGYLEDYVNAELEVAKELGIEIVDIYHGMGVNSENCNIYLEDTLHLSEYGRKNAADMIANCILGEAE